MLRLDDNKNNDNPSNNSNILVHLSDIKGDINSIKTAIEDAFARTFNFFKSELQKKELVEQNLRDDVRNLICDISFFKNIIERNYSNISSQTSLIDKKSVVNNSKIQNATKNLDFNESLIDFIVESENNQDKSNEKIKNNVEKEINVFVETNRNELELKSNGNVDYNNEKEITTVEKQLIDLRRRRHEEYLDYRLLIRFLETKKKHPT